MKSLANRILVAALFAALVLALLWFQGLILRPKHVTATVPPLPAPAPGQATAKVELRDVPRTQVQPGFVEALDAAPLAARVMASVLEVAVREGQSVELGDVLVRFDDRDARAQLAQAKAAQEAAQAQATAAQLAFERVERLKRGAAATEQDWESARAAQQGAQAAHERAAQGVVEAETALTWFELRAPFAGQVLTRHVEPGQLALPGAPLVTLFREGEVRVSVAVPQAQSTELSVGSRCELELDAGASRRGTVTRILPASDSATGSVTLHIALEDSSGLRPGQLARLSLELGSRQALLVPAAAIQRVGQIERVRVLERGRVQTALVRTGKRHGEFVEVLSGLRAGEEVLLP